MATMSEEGWPPSEEDDDGSSIETFMKDHGKNFQLPRGSGTGKSDDIQIGIFILLVVAFTLFSFYSNC
jgi:hypothetical protein